MLSSVLSIALFVRCDFSLARRILYAGAIPQCQLVSPLDFILLQDPRCTISFISCLLSAGFQVRPSGWIRRMHSRSIQERTSRETALLSLLDDTYKEPASLQHFCRISVRIQLGRVESSQGKYTSSFISRVDQLPLPKLLKCYITLDEDFGNPSQLL